MYPFLQGKNILLGVSGSVACYKSVELARMLRRMRMRVQVVVTPQAAQFISPQLFEKITGRQALVESSHAHNDDIVDVDLFVIFPATFEDIANFTSCIERCDSKSTVQKATGDILSKYFFSVQGSRIICPSVDIARWQDVSFQNQIMVLQKLGVKVLGPIEGEYSYYDLNPLQDISFSEVVWNILKSCVPQDFAGKKIVVSAGPTREWLDDNLFISTPSSGKIGYALAKAAALRGADVQLISGPTYLDEPHGVHRVMVEDASSMKKAFSRFVSWADVVIGAAAISDYWVSNRTRGRHRKSGADWTVSLQETEDILSFISQKQIQSKRPILVGFSLETSDVIERAYDKLVRKGIDLMVSHGPVLIGSDDAEVCLVFADRSLGSEYCTRMSKDAIAWYILDKIKPMVSLYGT